MAYDAETRRYLRMLSPSELALIRQQDPAFELPREERDSAEWHRRARLVGNADRRNRSHRSEFCSRRIHDRPAA